MKVLVTLVGCMGILVCIGFMLLAYFEKAYWVGAVWGMILTACFILILIARKAVDLMEMAS